MSGKRYWMALAVMALGVTGVWGGEAPGEGKAEARARAVTMRYDGTLRAFRRVATLDWGTALSMMAQPEVKLAWTRENGKLFGEALESAVFFTHSMLLFSGEGEDRWTGGIYNLWTDQWLLLDFVWVKATREYKVTGYAWVSGGDKVGELGGVTNVGELEKRLRARLENGVAKGFAAAKGKAAGVKGDRAVAARAAGQRVRAYQGLMRGTLAPEGGKEYAGLRTGVDDMLGRLSGAKKVKGEDIVAVVRGTVPWAATMYPVYVTTGVGTALVVLSSPEDPYKLVLGEFETEAGGGAVLKRVVAWDLTPGRGGQP